MATFIETTDLSLGAPRLALIAVRSFKTSSGRKWEKGDVRAIEHIGGRSLKSVRRDLVEALGIGSTFSNKNWRIAQGVIQYTGEEIAENQRRYDAQERANEGRRAEMIGQPEYGIEYRRIGSGYDNARPLVDRIERQVFESIGSVGDEARDALQAELDALDDSWSIYELRVVVTGTFTNQ